MSGSGGLNTITSSLSGSDASVLNPEGSSSTVSTINSGATRCTTQLDRTSSTTLTNIPGLTVNVVAGGSYMFRSHLTGTSTTNGGAKVAIGGTATATSTTFFVQNFNTTTTNAANTGSALSTAVAGTTTVFTDIIIQGTIVVANAGTLTVMFAQNASHADTSSVYVGSDFIVTRIS